MPILWCFFEASHVVGKNCNTDKCKYQAKLKEQRQREIVIDTAESNPQGQLTTVQHQTKGQHQTIINGQTLSNQSTQNIPPINNSNKNLDDISILDREQLLLNRITATALGIPTYQHQPHQYSTIVTKPLITETPTKTSKPGLTLKCCRSRFDVTDIMTNKWIFGMCGIWSHRHLMVTFWRHLIN